MLLTKICTKLNFELILRRCAAYFNKIRTNILYLLKFKMFVLHGGAKLRVNKIDIKTNY